MRSIVPSRRDPTVLGVAAAIVLMMLLAIAALVILLVRDPWPTFHRELDALDVPSSWRVLSTADGGRDGDDAPASSTRRWVADSASLDEACRELREVIGAAPGIREIVARTAVTEAPDLCAYGGGRRGEVINGAVVAAAGGSLASGQVVEVTITEV